MKHAVVPITNPDPAGRDWLIPLIGIKPDETKETCDGCHRKFKLWRISYTGLYYFCPKCLKATLTTRQKPTRKKGKLWK